MGVETQISSQTGHLPGAHSSQPPTPDSECVQQLLLPPPLPGSAPGAALPSSAVAGAPASGVVLCWEPSSFVSESLDQPVSPGPGSQGADGAASVLPGTQERSQAPSLPPLLLSEGQDCQEARAGPLFTAFVPRTLTQP